MNEEGSWCSGDLFDKVRERLPREELLAQMAEECAELAQAALKLRRVLDGTNPTPVTLEDAEANLSEEISDVFGCMVLVSANLGKDFSSHLPYKMERWAKRLERRDGETG